MKKCAGATLALIIVLAANLSFAGIIYEQYGGPESGNNPFCYDSQFIAQDFTVNTNVTLTSLTFNSYTTTDTVPLTDIYVRIYANGADSPGSLLYDQHLTGNFNGVATGGDGYYTFRDYQVTLPNKNFTAGTYWLALQAGPAQWDMHWSIPTWDTIGLVSKASIDGLTWDEYSFEHSFRLETSPAPIPPTALLFGFGLAFMPLVGFRRFKSV
jgi:hypothetical protein